MKRNQIFLNQRELKENKLFFKEMFQTNNFIDSYKWFDELKNSIAREVDNEMNLERFLRLIEPGFYIILQTGSPQEDMIRYCVRGWNEEQIGKFAWLECPYNQHNYDIVSNLFHDVYGDDLDSVPLPKSLEEYHKKGI